MKTRNYSRILTAITSFALLITGFSSCTKDDTGALSLTGTANVSVVNAVEGSAPQDYYADAVKVNSSAVAYTQNSGYVATPAGNHVGQFRATGTSTATASANVTFESNKYYTVYFTGNANSQSTFTSTDDMTAPDAGKAKVRFVHLASALATSSFDFGTSASSRIVTSLAYQTASAYNTVDANSNFTLYLAGSSTSTLTIPASLQAGKIYTIFISGSTTATLRFTAFAQN